VENFSKEFFFWTKNPDMFCCLGDLFVRYHFKKRLRRKTPYLCREKIKGQKKREKICNFWHFSIGKAVIHVKTKTKNWSRFDGASQEI